MNADLPIEIQVLGLLAREAAEPELLAALDTIRSSAATPAERAAARELSDAALTLQRSRQEDRRRAAALSALSETAAELTTHHDLDSLLRAICSRARMLLRTDVAYVMLLGPEAADTYVRATDGIV